MKRHLKLLLAMPFYRYADNGEVAPSAAPAAPSLQKRRVRRFMEVTVNGKKRLVGYWDFV